MSDEVFRCDYCGQLTPLRTHKVYWQWAETLADGRERFVPAVYCTSYCGAQHGRGAAGSGQG